MKTIKLILAITALTIVSSLTAQTTGIVKGTIMDEKGAPMLFVPVALLQDTVMIASATTDENGEFTIKEITPGNYNLKASYTGYDIQILKGIKVHPDQTAYPSIQMKPSANLLKQIVISAEYHESILNPTFTTMTKISIDQIENSAVGKTDIVGMITSVTPGVLPTDDGKDIYVRGSRRGSTAYYVDGNRTMTVPDVPGMGISGVEVLTGGVPAEYGDCTGGLVIITTKEYKWEMARKKMENEQREESEVKAPAKK